MAKKKQEKYDEDPEVDAYLRETKARLGDDAFEFAKDFVAKDRERARKKKDQDYKKETY